MIKIENFKKQNVMMIETEKKAILISYKTIVMFYDKIEKKLYKIDKFIKKDFYNQSYIVSSSVTTNKHISLFLNELNITDLKTKAIIKDETFFENLI